MFCVDQCHNGSTLEALAARSYQAVLIPPPCSRSMLGVLLLASQPLRTPREPEVNGGGVESVGDVPTFDRFAELTWNRLALLNRAVESV